MTATADLPGELIIPQRDEIAAKYRRDVRIRNPNATTVVGTLEYADSESFADAMVPVYYDAKTIGDYVADVNKKGPALETEIIEATGSGFLPAVGGSGQVIIDASTGGGTIFAGDEIKDPISRLRFQCAATKLYKAGDLVPITGLDVGPATNLPAGRQLSWTFNRPGINQNATVFAQANGDGLTGGRNAETDAEGLARLRSRRANPPASGNSADYQASMLKVPGLIVQQGFTWPCALGANTCGCSITLRPGTPGANRIPNATQLAAVLAYLENRYPAGDSKLMTTLVGSGVVLVFEATWAPTATSWEDVSPWPTYVPGDPVVVDGAVGATATAFRLTTGTTTAIPQVGQTIALYDQPHGAFVSKRLLTVSSVVTGKSWDVTVDPSNGASDVVYVPVAGQIASPWSDSLQSVVSSVTSFFDTIGPGEIYDPLPDPNLRGRRSPRSPSAYDNVLTNRITTNMFAVPTVGDIQLISPTVPHKTPVGTPGVLAYLFELGDLSIFPQGT